MKRSLLLVWAALVGVMLAGCRAFEDDGVHLATCLKDGAEKLKGSSDAELTVRYEPLDGLNQAYTVQFCANSAVVVWSKHGGSSTYHLNYVRVPTGFYLSKTNESVQVTLRKANGAVEVAEVR